MCLLYNDILDTARTELTRMAASQLGVESKYVVPNRRFGSAPLGDSLDLYKRGNLYVLLILLFYLSATVLDLSINNVS